MKFWDNVTSYIGFSTLARLSTSHFIQKIFAIKSQSRRKSFLAPLFPGDDPLFYSRLLTQFTIRRLAKFG